MRRILCFWGNSLWVVVGIMPPPVSGQVSSHAPVVSSGPSREPFQVSHDTSRRSEPVGTGATRRANTLLVLGKDTVRLSQADSLAEIDVWLGYQYEEAGRQKDAEAAYIRVLSKVSGSARTYAETRLRAMLQVEKAPKFRWIPWPVRSPAIWLVDRIGRVELLWLVGLIGFGLWWWRRAARRGKTQLRIQPFTRQLPSSVGLGIEDTIADLHKRTSEVGAPAGVLLNSGLKLPVMSTAPSENLAELVGAISQQPWIPKVLGWILKGSDNPRFVVRGHVEGTLWAVRIVVGLDDDGLRVRTWDRTLRFYQLIDGEQELACQVIYTLSESNS